MIKLSTSFKSNYSLVAVNKVMEFGKAVAYTVFEPSTGQFKEVKDLKNSYVLDERLLPEIDGFSFELITKGLLVLGTVTSKDAVNYVVCDGSRLIHYYDIGRLSEFNLLNTKVSDRNSLELKDSILLNDLSFLFENDTVDFLDIPKYSSTGSSGQNVKLLGVDRITGKYGLVKFPLTSRSLDCKNEVACKNLATLFNVPCCHAIEVSYMRRTGVLSVYEYDRLLGISPKSLRQVLQSNGKSGLMDFSFLVKKYGKEFEDDYLRSVIFDTITLQEDRHESNLSILQGKLYPLYDNGRSLLNGNAGQRFNNNYSLVKRLGPSKVKSLINSSVSYEEIFNAIYSVYGEPLKNLAQEITDRVYDLLIELTSEVVL